MASRGKVRLECWDQVDTVLAELGRVQKRLEAVAAERAAALARAEAEAAARSGPLEARRLQLETAVERFCRRHGPELDRVNGHALRSRRLLFGRVGYRTSHAVEIRDEAAALRRLAQWRQGQQFLRLHTELDREALREFLLRAPDGSDRATRIRRRVRRAGINVEQRESWFYELNPKAFDRWA